MHNMRLKLAVIILMVVNFHRIPNTKVNKTHRTELENYYVFIIADTLHICSFCILNDRIHQSSSSRSELSFGFFVLFVWLFFFFSGVCSVSTVFFCSIRWLVNFLDLVFGLSRMWATKKEVFEVWEIKVVCLQWMKTWMNWRHIPPKRKQQQPPPKYGHDCVGAGRPKLDGELLLITLIFLINDSFYRGSVEW